MFPGTAFFFRAPGRQAGGCRPGARRAAQSFGERSNGGSAGLNGVSRACSRPRPERERRMFHKRVTCCAAAAGTEAGGICGARRPLRGGAVGSGGGARERRSEVFRTDRPESTGDRATGAARVHCRPIARTAHDSS